MDLPWTTAAWANVLAAPAPADSASEKTDPMMLWSVFDPAPPPLWSDQDEDASPPLRRANGR